ncbi:MAG: SUMF1/EgtB/PvdO family nonheme iron enzyme [Bacteroidaceae bacterium]|nr:SUMF1/EgtB/PvdO family nonheme iron enzyme [Bacteroidaceae bacterium]
MTDNKYDIFISYRRDGGAQYARILQLMLIQRGYRVFLDYDELTDGVFSDKIRAAIKDAPVFMLVLSKGALVRCANDGDWVREEITLAIEQNKHIIPVNPDNGFDGIPPTLPVKMQDTIGSLQHSEISFGQALGATIDLMINNRLIPTIGKRQSSSHRDEDFDAAQETLRRQDAHNKFMKRVGVTCAIAVIAIVLGALYWFWNHNQQLEAKEDERKALELMRTELEKKHSDFHLMLSPGLTELQMATIDTILTNMVAVRPDTLWMSQFEFTTGQWHGVFNTACNAETAHIPMTDVSYGEICMNLLDSLRNMTGIDFDLPSADEWEYAARGGSKPENTIYVGDDDVLRVAWYSDNSDGHPHPSDGRQGLMPNILDIYDMSGNVGELCNSLYEGATFTVCGGNYTSPAEDVAITSRTGIATDKTDKTVGFRLIIRR